MTRVIEINLPERSESNQLEREAINLVINGKDTGQKVYIPTIEQISLFSRVASKLATPVDKMAGIFRFLEAITDEDSYQYIMGRFEDPQDPLDFEWLTDFVLSMSNLGQEEINTAPSNRAERRGTKAAKTTATASA